MWRRGPLWATAQNVTDAAGHVPHDVWSTPLEFLQRCERLSNGHLGNFSMLAPIFRPATATGFGGIIAALTDLYRLEQRVATGVADPLQPLACLRGATPLERHGVPRFALVMLVAYNQPHASWVNTSIANKRSYAARHGYAFEVFAESDTGRPAAWSKLVALLHVLGRMEAEWVVWVDLDTVIMRPAVALTLFVDPRASSSRSTTTASTRVCSSCMPRTGRACCSQRRGHSTPRACHQSRSGGSRPRSWSSRETRTSETTHGAAERVQLVRHFS